MIALLKFLDVPWEIARGYLREDLDHIESAINRRWAATFGDSNLLKPETIGGDPTPATRYVANTGPDNSPKWDQVNLSNGVTNRLPFSNLTQASIPPSVLGRTGSAGDFQELGIGSGLAISNGALSSVPSTDSSSDAFLELFRYAFTRIDFLEAALKIEYGKNDILVPEELELLEQ